MAKTLSFAVGRVAIMHDVRKEISANIDTGLMHRNVVIVDKLKEFDYSVEKYTNARFQPVIDAYNAKQTREERKKNMSYTDIIAEENRKLIAKAKENKEKGIMKSVRKPTRLCHEYVFQVGDRNTNGTLTGDYEKNVEYVEEVVKAIEKKYPHVKILLATLHADEPDGSLHCHILVQFEGEQYKQGLSTQVSMSKALELDGFERSQNRGDYAINRWCQDIKDTIMTEKLREIFHEEPEIIGEHRKHEDITIFREKAKREERAVQDLRKERADIQDEIDALHGDYLLNMAENDCLEADIASKSEKIKELDKSIVEKENALKSSSTRLQDAITACQLTEATTRAIIQDQQNIIALRDELVGIINQKSRDLGIAWKRTTEGYVLDMQKVLTSLTKKHNNQHQRTKNYSRHDDR